MVLSTAEYRNKNDFTTVLPCCDAVRCKGLPELNHLPTAKGGAEFLNIDRLKAAWNETPQVLRRTRFTGDQGRR